MALLSQFILLATICSSCVFAGKLPQMSKDRSVMVHLFEWKWTDIARECEQFLAPRGYGGIQVSPPNEHALKNRTDGNGNLNRPWWQRYQPVSYKLVSRSGTEQQFIDMVNRCNAVGVRIYVDAVINHMAAGDDDKGFHTGSAGSIYDPDEYYFPAVPYTREHFGIEKCGHSKSRTENDRNCDLLSLKDLDTGSEYVRAKLAEYMNRLIDIGVAGFRLDAARHVWPGDIQNIVDRLKPLRSDIFGDDKKPFIFSEVYSEECTNPSEYTVFGRLIDFAFGEKLKKVITKGTSDYGTVEKLTYLQNFGPAWQFLPDDEALIFLDNHDRQRNDDKYKVLTFKDSKSYKIGSAFMLAWPYGLPQVMSSFNFDFFDQSAPTNNGMDTKDVIVLEDGSCGNGWVCEHRWRQIANMVKFRNVAGNSTVQNWWSNNEDQIAFSRGDRAFIVINNDWRKLDETLKTGLPAGMYCDVISGDLIDGKCTGRLITVNDDGTAHFFLENRSNDENPMIAIHLESKL